MPSPEDIRTFFHKRAETAEQLYREGKRAEAKLIATVAIDALATIWAHDFQGEVANLSSTQRMAAFISRFADDPRIHRVAVVLFAEDLLRHSPSMMGGIANRLLDARVADRTSARSLEMRESPRSYLDKTVDDLVLEEPRLHDWREMIEEYSYPALLYRFFRCSLAHSLMPSPRTNDFSSREGDDEISYFHAWQTESRARPLSLKIGILAITRWLRESADGFAEHCIARGIEPAATFIPNVLSSKMLDGKWERHIASLNRRI